LCIDQDNLLKRNAQVAMMSRIYRQAQRVIVWLGVEDEFSLPAIATVSKLASIGPDGVQNASNYALGNVLSYSRFGIPLFSRDDWLSVYVFFSRSWFRRAWIVQEAALARQTIVVCGSAIFPWTILVWASDFLKRSLWGPQLDLYVLLIANFVALTKGQVLVIDSIKHGTTLQRST
jgi:hypothetical protein